LHAHVVGRHANAVDPWRERDVHVLSKFLDFAFVLKPAPPSIDQTGTERQQGAGSSLYSHALLDPIGAGAIAPSSKNNSS